MADQLSLFPETEASSSGADETARVVSNALDEMFAASYGQESGSKTMRMLETVVRFPQYSIFNGFLIHTQKPDASMVATASVWERRYNRKPSASAKPVIILAPMSPVHFLYDIEDTTGEPVPQAIPDVQEAAAAFPNGATDCICKNCRLHGVAVRPSGADPIAEPGALSLTYNIRKQFEYLDLGGWFNYLVFADENAGRESRFADLVHGLAFIFLGHLGIDNRAWWKDRRGTPRKQAEAEARSVAYLVTMRRGLSGIAKNYCLSDDAGDALRPPFSLSAVLNAAQYIEDMGKACWEAPKRKSRYS